MSGEHLLGRGIVDHADNIDPRARSRRQALTSCLGGIAFCAIAFLGMALVDPRPDVTFAQQAIARHQELERASRVSTEPVPVPLVHERLCRNPNTRI